jgi:hypothetical protein
MGNTTTKIVLTDNIARAILSEVAAGDWLDKEIPEDESEIIDLAGYYVDHALEWIAEGNPDNQHINAIINLSKVSPPVLSEVAVHNHDGTPPGEIKTKEEKVRETYPRRSSGGYSESDLRVDSEELDWENAVVKEGLPIPQRTEEEAPLNMPTDLTDLGDKALRRLYSAFNSYLGRARWMLAISSSNQANATHLRDESYRVSFLSAYKKSKLEGEKLSQAILEQLAQDTENYKSWSVKVRKHSDEVTSWRALSDIYSKNVEVLSREWSMRIDERGN